MKDSDPDFTPEERLFRRLNPRWWAGPFINGSQVPVHVVEFPRCSVNREKYSAPEDVIGPGQEHFGIGAFKVEDVPPELKHRETEALFRFPVVHCPEDGNYAHSEVRSHDETGTERKPSAVVKKLFRLKLRRKIQILQQPQVPG